MVTPRNGGKRATKTHSEQSNRSQYDTVLKDLFRKPPQHLLQALLGEQAVRRLPVEFPSTQKRIPDLVFHMQNDTILHLDLQSRPENMDWRMLMYYAFIRRDYPELPILQKVLYVGEDLWRPKATIDEPYLHFRYEVLDIREMDCLTLMASPILEENILAILCRQHDTQATLREILLRISELPGKARADALTSLLILSRLRKLEFTVKEEADKMALVFNIMENDVLRPIFLQAQLEAEQRGE
ncbi:MAG: hypothetical protein HQM06_15000, partial [Magnetococcales bacterium]|nr:hypothetical protein [Magnetococcales bacterium]